MDAPDYDAISIIITHDHSFTPIQTGNDRLESRAAPPPLYVDRIIATDSTVHANTLQNEEYYRYLNTPPYVDTTLQSIKTPRKPIKKVGVKYSPCNIVADNLISSLAKE